MRFKAFIMIPKANGNAFELTKGTDDELDAFHWLARKVADHPDSEIYGIEDTKLHRMIHQAGVVAETVRLSNQSSVISLEKEAS